MSNFYFCRSARRSLGINYPLEYVIYAKDEESAKQVFTERYISLIMGDVECIPCGIMEISTTYVIDATLPNAVDHLYWYSLQEILNRNELLHH